MGGEAQGWEAAWFTCVSADHDAAVRTHNHQRCPPEQFYRRAQDRHLPPAPRSAHLPPATGTGPLPTHAACWEGHAKGTRGAFAEKCPKTKHSAQTLVIFVVKSHTAQRGGKGLRWAFAGGIRPEKGAFASKNGPSGPSRAILNIKTHTKRGLQAGELNAFKIKKGHPHLRHWALEGRSGSHTTLFLEFY